MDWGGDNIAETFNLSKQRMALILTDDNVVDPAKQAVQIQIAIGNAINIMLSTLSDADKLHPVKLYKLFEDQLAELVKVQNVCT